MVENLEQNSQPEQEDFMPQMSPVYKGFAFVWEIAKVVLISLAIIIPVRYFLVQPFFVNGASMEENFNDGDYILIDEITFRYPNDQTQFFIKRVIGLPGETVEVKNDTVKIFSTNNPTGTILMETAYLSPEQETKGTLRIKLDPNEYFVMGDNRLHSSDSRSWGPVNRSLITGRVFGRAWPITQAEFVHTPAY